MIKGDQIVALLEMLTELGVDPIDAPGELARQGGVLAGRELRTDLGYPFRRGRTQFVTRLFLGRGGNGCGSAAGHYGNERQREGPKRKVRPFAA
jgi:hypothetical protein